jgi:hypothetical protein
VVIAAGVRPLGVFGTRVGLATTGAGRAVALGAAVEVAVTLALALASARTLPTADGVSVESTIGEGVDTGVETATGVGVGSTGAKPAWQPLSAQHNSVTASGAATRRTMRLCLTHAGPAVRKATQAVRDNGRL